MKKNYGYSFVFESGDVDTRKVISVKAQDQPVDAVVKQILYGQDVSYEIKEKNIIVRKTVHAPVQLVTQQQGKRITGVVADTNGEPVIGANVVEKGTTNGTVTDVDGRFSLAVSNNATLVVSFIGYNAQELVVGDQTDLKIILAESSLGLDEVVVVGYGTQKKVNLTGSVSTISAEKLTQTPSANLTNAMAGRLSGVIATNKNGLPGSGSDLQVRGLSTLNNNQPLIVIDGIIGRDLSNIDPNEIQSISVLKDASSSVYGARAANGVFLVTTKRGTIGKPKISYTGMVGIQQPTQYPELMNAYQWAYTRNQAMRNQGYDPSNPAQASMFFTDQQMADFQSGKVGTDWYDQTMKKNSMQTQHNLSVNGGSEMIRYFMSLGYLNQDGMFDNIGFRRYNLRANVDAKITQHLDVGANLEGRQMNYHTPGNGVSKIFNDLLWVQPTFKSPYHPDGKPADTGGEHPLEDIKSSGYDRQTTGEYQGTLFFDYRLPFITPGLSLKGNASLYKQIFFSKRFFTPFALYQEDAEGNVTSINQRGTISLSEEVRQLNAFNYNISLNYAHTFKKHDVAALLLFEQSEETGDNLNGSRQDFSTTIKDELYASGTANQTISGTSVLNEARRSVVGRINYAFSSKYLLEFSFRYDGSYRFPKETRFGFFPSVSAGWRISEESFFKNSSALQFVDNLKIRGAKGLIGNDRINAFQFTDAYSINSASGPVFGGTSQTLINYGV
ncbi:MAG: SusC/RagA family TonB-linked outer membrane protein, partial [Tannerella sp.]|nr:SusC/RagA family TonB-linked outer membrane protein [Tannerella sp.]